MREEVARFHGRNGNGHESRDPEVLLKMMFLLFFDHLPSERELVKKTAEPKQAVPAPTNAGEEAGQPKKRMQQLVNRTHLSTTDPDARMYHDKPRRFSNKISPDVSEARSTHGASSEYPVFAGGRTCSSPWTSCCRLIPVRLPTVPCP